VAMVKTSNTKNSTVDVCPPMDVSNSSSDIPTTQVGKTK